MFLDSPSTFDQRFSAPRRRSPVSDASKTRFVGSIITDACYYAFASSRDWADYIDHLRTNIDKLDIKACHSSVGRPTKMDFSVQFTDCQRLQEYRRKLLRAMDALTSNIQVIEGCQTRYQRASKLYGFSVRQDIIDDLATQAQELKNHKYWIKHILEYSSGTANLLGKILEFRHDETMRTQTQILTELSEGQKRSAEHIAELQSQTAEDSGLLKALTALASLYLPASLVATLLGSNLVQVQESVDSKSALHVRFVDESWVIYFATVVPLIVLTLVFIVWLEKRPAKFWGTRP